MNSNEIQCGLDDLSNNKQNNLQFQDEGVNLGTPGSIDTVNFIGDCIQAVKVGGKLNVFVNCPQIPTTTSTTTLLITTTTTTSTSTTSTTTIAPCNCYSIENLTSIPLTYTWRPCGTSTTLGAVLPASKKQYLCTTPQHVPQQIVGLTKVQSMGDCSTCSPIFNTTTTTSSTTTSSSTTTTSSSTTTTTTAPCDDLILQLFEDMKGIKQTNPTETWADIVDTILDKGFVVEQCRNCCPECNNTYIVSSIETFLKYAEAVM